MRQVLQILVPLLLPTALYFVYLKIARRRATPGAPTPDVPWIWLGVAGAALLVISLAAVAVVGGAPPGSVYEPAKLIDGKIQPGHFED